MLPQPLNASLPMEVTEAGITTCVRAEQFLNAVAPILVTPLGIETSVSALQPSKADTPISVRKPPAIWTEVSPMSFIKALSLILVTPAGIAAFVRKGQSLKALLPRVTRDAGILNGFELSAPSFAQPSNALLPIEITESGRFMLSRWTH